MNTLNSKEYWIQLYNNILIIIYSISLKYLKIKKEELGKWNKKIFPSSRGLINTTYTGYNFANKCVLQFGLVERNATSTIVK